MGDEGSVTGGAGRFGTGPERSRGGPPSGCKSRFGTQGDSDRWTDRVSRLLSPLLDDDPEVGLLATFRGGTGTWGPKDVGCGSRSVWGGASDSRGETQD